MHVHFFLSVHYLTFLPAQECALLLQQESLDNAETRGMGLQPVLPHQRKIRKHGSKLETK